MNWIEATIFFPVNRITRETIDRYVAKYSVEIRGPQDLNGQLMTLEPGEENKSLSIICVDNTRLALFRKLSHYDGTLAPMPLYDPPLAEDESEDDREPIGYIITALWPKAFRDDVLTQTDPDLEGIYIMEDDA